MKSKCTCTTGQVTYNLRSTINVQVLFPDFAGNLRAQKPNKAQRKRENITGVQYFPGFWSCLRAHEQEWCQLHLIVYSLFILLPHYLRQLPFSPPPPPEYATTDRVRLPLGPGGHAKAYDRVAPQPLNKADTTMTMYPAAADPSANHRASGDASVIAPVSGINNVFYSLF